jgi:UDPglucose--hexose-1-phosphate uridylyltransferase
MSDDPELRRDPVTGRWAVVAPRRANRPINLPGHEPRGRTTGERQPCPFCPGQEHDTPDEVYALRAPGSPPNGPGWRLRVVPNKYPAASPDADHVHARPGAGDERPLFESAPATGRAEVVIDCPEHVSDPVRLTDEQFRDVFLAYRARVAALAADPRLAHSTPARRSATRTRSSSPCPSCRPTSGPNWTARKPITPAPAGACTATSRRRNSPAVSGLSRARSISRR